MTRWDKQITAFLENDNVFCGTCPGHIKMVFDSKMGYFRCGSCGMIKAPNLVGKDHVNIPLYWSMCRTCNNNNVTEKDQEPYWLVLNKKTGKVEVIPNPQQRKIHCSNCDSTFTKEYPKVE